MFIVYILYLFLSFHLRPTPMAYIFCNSASTAEWRSDVYDFGQLLFTTLINLR